MMPSFSIIICTYNPAPEIFHRLLDAILAFPMDAPAHEVILVDNNSTPKLADREDVKKFLLQKPNAALIEQQEPGLTPSRIAGIKKAKHDWVIFFDDDNEPASDYLSSAVSGITQYSNTGAWGPGIIEVEYTDSNAPLWLEDYKTVFQQRKNNKVESDNNTWWQYCYPFGTGLIIKKTICQEYLKYVKSGVYSLSDRKGKSLTSGGDMQLVYTGLKMGYAAGISPSVQLKHLITPEKSTPAYLTRLFYGTAACNLPAYYQCFPEKFIEENYRLPTFFETLKKLYFLFKTIWINKGKREFCFALAQYLGEAKGVSDLLKRKISLHLLLLEKLLKLN